MCEIKEFRIRVRTNTIHHVRIIIVKVKVIIIIKGKKTYVFHSKRLYLFVC